MTATHNSQSKQRGFTLVELVVATAVLLFGVVAVIQLVPAAMQANLRNRYDSTSSVMAQRLEELFARQILTDPFVEDPTGVMPCSVAAQNCAFGDPAQNNLLVGSPVRAVLTANGRLADMQIDFGAAAVPRYNAVFIDPNDAARTAYEVRWAVITSVQTVGTQTNVVVAKRIIVGARRLGDQSTSVSFNMMLSR